MVEYADLITARHNKEKATFAASHREWHPVEVISGKIVLTQAEDEGA